MKNFLIKLNDKAALGLMAVYGMAITIWLFALYSLLGAFVSNSVQNNMLYWSNAAQLVFCPLSIYVGKLVLKSHKEIHRKTDENSAKLDAIHKHLGIKQK
jgi:hypothetical protein